MQLKNLLVVIDPTSKDKQPSLDRASLVATRTGASVELLICDHNSALEDGFFTDRAAQQRARAALLAERLDWLEELVKPLQDKASRQPARFAGANRCTMKSSPTSKKPIRIWYSVTPPPTVPCSACCLTTPAGN